MKLTTFFFLISILSVAARGYSQHTRLSLSLQNASIQELFQEIEKQSKFNFFYKNDQIDINKMVNIEADNSLIGEVLNEVFENSVVSYTVVDQVIVITPRKEQQNFKVTGTVTASTGETLPGVNILVKGTGTGTITGMDGNYSIEVTDAYSVLIFSFVGYITQEVIINDRSVIDVTLEESIEALDEVVVIGYGTQKKVNLTGSISQVGPEILENRSVTSVSQALQGTMSGVTVQQTDGAPGSNANIRIRGFSSLNSGGALVIIDGVPGSLNNLNPNDIESISVLKDAASAAIYGARAAEGVILVTTKKGKAGKIKVQYQGYVSLLKPTIFPKLNRSADGAVIANLAAQNAGTSAFYTQDQIAAMKDPTVTAIPRADGTEWDYVADFDWAGYFLDNAFNQGHNLSLSGGGNGHNYLISGSWLDQNGYFAEYGPDNFDRYTLRLNMNNELLKDKLFLDTRLNFVSSDRLQNSTGTSYLIQSVIQAGRGMPLYNPDGTYARYRMQQNTMQLLKEAGFDEDISNRFEGRMSLTWNVTKELEMKALAGYNVAWTKGNLFGRSYYKYRPEGPPDRFGWANQPNRVIMSSEYNSFYNSQLLATYTKSIGNHNLKVLAGGSVEENFYEYVDATRFNILGNELPAMNLGDADNAMNSYNGSEWGIVSGFGRLNYDFAGKYLFEANVRADGSSRFSKKHKWGLFPSLSIGWRLSEEAFMKDQTVFSNLKLRASYGQVGNQNGLGLYDHIPIYNVSSRLIPFPTIDAQQIYNPRLPSQDRTWETVINSNVGVEMGFFDNRLFVEADYFIKRNKDMLINIEVPSVIGITVPTNNYGELETKGWEALVKWKDNIESIGLKYSVEANVYDQTDKIVDLEQEFVNIASGFRNLQGYPVNSIFAYEADGYFQTQGEVDSWAFQHVKTGPGDIKYIDQDDDGKISAPNDLIFAGTLTPRYVYGINLRAEWKGFDLSLFFQGVGKRNYYLSGRSVQPYYNPWDNNSNELHNDYWTPDNPDAIFPRPYMRSGWNYFWSTHWMQDASYIRLKNLQFGYNIPAGILSKIGIANARIYFSSENLWEKTNLLMFDPELSSTGGNMYPLNRSYSLGFNVTF